MVPGTGSSEFEVLLDPESLEVSLLFASDTEFPQAPRHDGSGSEGIGKYVILAR